MTFCKPLIICLSMTTSLVMAAPPSEKNNEEAWRIVKYNKLNADPSTTEAPASTKSSESVDDTDDTETRNSALSITVKEVPISFDYELDAYYTNASIYIPLTNQAIKDVGETGEFEIYRTLALQSFSPRFFLIEASINPLPVLGLYLKREQRDFYDDFDIGDDLNLIQAITEGFEEPYALSFFLGNVVRFSSPGEVEKTKNKGYTGFLLSVGDQHIKDNVAIDDNWYEFEWKLKGDKRLRNKNLSWSFRLGSKIHDNKEITDVYYLGFRRSHFNKSKNDFSIFKNSGIDYKIEFDKDNGDLVAQQIFIDKKWPFKKSDGAFSLGIGLLQDVRKYSGSLESPNDDSDTSLIIRPSFTF